MKLFPPLSRWFNSSSYFEHNKCKTITLLFKSGLSVVELDSFIKEFAKLICRIRCNGPLYFGQENIDLCKKFQNAIDDVVTLDSEERDFLAKYIFFDGMISQNKYDQSNNYIQSIDRDLFNGYFGEVLFYIVREQYLEDEKIMIEPNLPKNNSKHPGLDYVEIRKIKNEDDYYFIVGEVKTTTNTIGNYPDMIIDSLIKRPEHLIYQEINAFKERARLTGTEDLQNFIDKMPIYFNNKTPSLHKRFAGVINYGTNKAPGRTVFQNFRPNCINYLYDSADCHRVKLIGISNIENIKDKVLEIIWTKL